MSVRIGVRIVILWVFIILQISWNVSSLRQTTDGGDIKEMLAINGDLTPLQSQQLADCLQSSTHDNDINTNLLTSCLHNTMTSPNQHLARLMTSQSAACPSCKNSNMQNADDTVSSQGFSEGRTGQRVQRGKKNMVMLSKDAGDGMDNLKGWIDGNKSWMFDIPDNSTEDSEEIKHSLNAMNGMERNDGGATRYPRNGYKMLALRGSPRRRAWARSALKKRIGEHLLIEAMQGNDHNTMDQELLLKESQSRDNKMSNDWLDELDHVTDDSSEIDDSMIDDRSREEHVGPGSELNGIISITGRGAGNRERSVKTSGLGVRETTGPGGKESGAAHRLMWVGYKKRGSDLLRSYPDGLGISWNYADELRKRGKGRTADAGMRYMGIGKRAW